MKKVKKQDNQFQFEVILPPEEGGFTVEVPDLPGCISKATLEEAENVEGYRVVRKHWRSAAFHFLHENRCNFKNECDCSSIRACKKSHA